MPDHQPTSIMDSVSFVESTDPESLLTFHQLDSAAVIPRPRPVSVPARAVSSLQLLALTSPTTSSSQQPSRPPSPHGRSDSAVLDSPSSFDRLERPGGLSVKLLHLALGDDYSVQDRWYGHGSAPCPRSAIHSGSVVPVDAHVFERWSSVMSVEPEPSTQAGWRTLAWYYLQTFLYSVVVALPVLPLVYCFSLVHWHVEDPLAGEGVPVYLPNHAAVQWALFAQCVFSLAIYAVVLYMAMMRTFSVPRPLILATAGVIAYALIAVALFWHYDVAVWYYYLDLVLIATTFLPMICMVGWLAAGPEATLQERVDEVLFVALLEVLVAVATLIYTTFLMPLFFTLTNAWLQLLWICIIHPLYFEVTTAAVVRKALHRQAAKGRTAIVNFLPIVHAMVHLVGLGISLMASIEPTHIMALSVLVYNVGKLTWRSTVLWRDLLVERVWRRDWSFTYSDSERLQLCKLISLAVLTELILENSAIIAAPFMLWCMYKEPIFMTVVPNTYFSMNGTYPVASLLAMIGIMYSFTFAFDLLFFALNYYQGQRLPIIYTWRKIKEGKWAYLGFLTYALATMGVMFSFSMMLILPRAAYCRSDNYCDCILPAYHAVCKGEYISMMVDYLVGGPNT